QARSNNLASPVNNPRGIVSKAKGSRAKNQRTSNKGSKARRTNRGNRRAKASSRDSNRHKECNRRTGAETVRSQEPSNNRSNRPATVSRVPMPRAARASSPRGTLGQGRKE